MNKLTAARCADLIDKIARVERFLDKLPATASGDAREHGVCLGLAQIIRQALTKATSADVEIEQ